MIRCSFFCYRFSVIFTSSLSGVLLHFRELHPSPPIGVPTLSKSSSTLNHPGPPSHPNFLPHLEPSCRTRFPTSVFTVVSTQPFVNPSYETNLSEIQEIGQTKSQLYTPVFKPESPTDLNPNPRRRSSHTVIHVQPLRGTTRVYDDPSDLRGVCRCAGVLSKRHR